jgi:hypothetical protein
MANTKKTLAQKLNLTQLKAKIIPVDTSSQKEVGLVSIPYRETIFTVGLTNIVVIALIFILKRFIPPQIPLYYGLAEGEEQLASNSLFLALPSLVSLAMIILNTTLASLIKDDFIKKMLIVACAATSFFSVVTTIRIFLLVGGI